MVRTTETISSVSSLPATPRPSAPPLSAAVRVTAPAASPPPGAGGAAGGEALAWPPPPPPPGMRLRTPRAVFISGRKPVFIVVTTVPECRATTATCALGPYSRS